MDAIVTKTASGGSATNRAYRELRHRILTGLMAPGARLKVEALKDLLDIGASPIREALSLLTSDQLVERIDQRGFRVADVGTEQFAEILKLRCALEDMALRESLLHGDQHWEEALVLAHHRMAREPRDSVDVFEEMHKAFHMAVLAACRSPILLRFCVRLYDLNIRYRYLAGKASGYAIKRDVGQEHEDILAAALDRDVDRASAVLIDHYCRTGEFLVTQLQSMAQDPATSSVVPFKS